jgi:hypothetical protein
LKTILRDAFEDSDIDCSEEIIAQGIVSIDMPVETWNKVRKLLEL